LAADLIISKYADLFELGSTNPLGETALILAIKNNSFTNAYTLVSEYLNECNPEQLTNDEHLSALDYMLQKDRDIIEDNKEIVINLLEYYIEHEPRSPVFHRNIDIICRNKDFYIELFANTVLDGRLDLNEQFCKDVVNTEANIGLVTDLHTNVPNTRAMGNIGINALRVHSPRHLDNSYINFPIEYTREEEENFRIDKRRRNEHPDDEDENRGGTKKRKLKKSKKRKTNKNPKNKKRQNKTKRQRRLK